jgi:glycosyltransferase involved in cell wall biosynthesis
MLHALRNSIFLNVKNIPGWRTSRKLVVIECDDWGSIRMPSATAYMSLINSGLNVDTSRFNRFDTMESSKDLEQLFETLMTVTDYNGNPAVMTAVTCMSNPDFTQIRSGAFKEYYFEPFTQTLKKYYPEGNVFEVWSEGIRAGIFIPELHGREHISVQLWLDKLREGNKELLLAFDHGFTSLDIAGVPLPLKEFRTEFYFTSNDQIPFLKESIKNSVSLFREIFGRSPRLFVPANGVFHAEFDKVVDECGVPYLYVSNSMPYPTDGGKLKSRYFVAGQKGPGQLIYYTRNCAFEPTDEQYAGIGLTLSQIEAAFRWGKPATISTHRVNYVGGISVINREKGLTELRKLLKAIVEKWPDVEFMSAGDALDYMKGR